MEPTLTIIEYLWDARNTWIKHHEECDCPREELIENFLDQYVTVDMWSEIVVTDEGPIFVLLQMRADEWSEVVGPKAQCRAIEARVTALMEESSRLIAMQATYERIANNG